MERIDDIQENRDNSNGKRLLVGLLFLFFGAMVLAKHMGWFPVNLMPYLFSWKSILIGIGILGLIYGKHTTVNLVLILIGSFFILSDIYQFPFDAKRLFIPIMLIFVGLMLIFQRKRPLNNNHWSRSLSGSDDYIDDVSIFGGGKINISTDNFKGGKITSIFGGSEINLLNSKMAEGNNVIDVFAVFGGSKLLIPADWSVRMEVMSIFGGYSDKRTNFTDASRKENKILYIKGLVVFGGGEIKNF